MAEPAQALLKVMSAFVKEVALRPVTFIAQTTSCIIMAIVPLSPALAQWHIEARAGALLPPYCKYTAIYRGQIDGMTAAEDQYWKAAMGRENFKHIHHYCRGLEHTNRALYFERTKADRDQALTASIGEFDYVLDNVKRTFALVPEILTKKGENLLRLGASERGVEQLRRAIAIKADYWPAHAALSDHHRDIGAITQAREWLQLGLAAAPDAQPLRRRLAELEARAEKERSK